MLAADGRGGDRLTRVAAGSVATALQVLFCDVNRGGGPGSSEDGSCLSHLETGSRWFNSTGENCTLGWSGASRPVDGDPCALSPSRLEGSILPRARRAGDCQTPLQVAEDPANTLA